MSQRAEALSQSVYAQLDAPISSFRHEQSHEVLYLCYWSLPRFVRVVWHGAQLVGIANFNASVSLLDDADQSCVMSIGGGIKLASTWNQTLFGACGFFPRSVSTCLCLWYFTSLHLHSCADIFVIRLSPRSFTLVSWASCVCDFKDVTRSRAWLSCVVEENDLPRHRMQIYTNNFLRWEVRLNRSVRRLGRAFLMSSCTTSVEAIGLEQCCIGLYIL